MITHLDIYREYPGEKASIVLSFSTLPLFTELPGNINGSYIYWQPGQYPLAKDSQIEIKFTNVIKLRALCIKGLYLALFTVVTVIIF